MRGWLFTSTYGGGRTAFEGGNLLESAFVELVCPPKVKMLVKILVKILGAAEKSKKSENFGGLLEACFGHLGHQSPLAPHRVWSQRDARVRVRACGCARAGVCVGRACSHELGGFSQFVRGETFGVGVSQRETFSVCVSQAIRSAVVSDAIRRGWLLLSHPFGMVYLLPVTY